MGLLSLFGKKTPEAIAEKHAPRIADKRGYAPDRWDSIRLLSDLAHPAAAKVLLTRFTFRTEPGITDQEEKDLAFRGVIAAGEGAVPHIREFLGTAESATWAVKMLAALLPEDQVVATLCEALGALEAAYTKDPQRKVQLLMELEARPAPSAVDTVLPFLEDPNESVRFHAVAVLAAQSELGERVKAALFTLYAGEESGRVRAAVLDALQRHGDRFPTDTAHLARAKAPNGYGIAADGSITRS